MKLGSMLVGVVLGYTVHKMIGAQLDKGVDPAIAAIKEQVEKKFKGEPAAAPSPGSSDAIQMS